LTETKVELLTKEEHEMRVITVRLPSGHIDGIQSLVELGIYSSKSEVIRRALRELLRRDEVVVKTLRKVNL